MSLENKIALITGGSRGLGKNAALRLAADGVGVILTYHQQAEAAQVQAFHFVAAGEDIAAGAAADGAIFELNVDLRIDPGGDNGVPLSYADKPPNGFFQGGILNEGVNKIAVGAVQG